MLGKGEWSAGLAEQTCYEIPTHPASLDNEKGALCAKCPGQRGGMEGLETNVMGEMVKPHTGKELLVSGFFQ